MPYVNDNNESIWYSISLSDNEVINLMYDPEECGYDSSNESDSTSSYWEVYCTYIVGVYGKSNTSRFELTSHSNKTIL